MKQRGLFAVSSSVFFATHGYRQLTPTMAPANKSTILDDPFIRSYIDDVLRSLRTQYLIDLINPYTRMELGFLAKVSDVAHKG